MKPEQQRIIIAELNAGDILQEESTKEEKPVCVVRLITTYWHNSTGVFQKKTLRFLRRKCKGFNVLEEDCSIINASEVVTRIRNLDECKDGIYQVITCNEYSSWETPHIIEDYDYKLIPYET